MKNKITINYDSLTQNRENREECIRCLGAYLHYSSAVLNSEKDEDVKKLNSMLTQVQKIIKFVQSSINYC